MPEEDFIIWLEGQTYIKVDFVTGGGTVLSFTVRLMLCLTHPASTGAVVIRKRFSSPHPFRPLNQSIYESFIVLKTRERRGWKSHS
jgi:hypothetical protein